MAGRNLLDAAPAAGAKRNKEKIVKIAAASVLAMLLLMAAVIYMARSDPGQFIAFVASDSFLVFCVASHAATICFLAFFAATARTPASRRIYGNAIVACFVDFALNLYMVLFVRRVNVQDITA